MKRAFLLSAVALLGLTMSAWAGGLLCHCCATCKEIPPPDCPNCGCACDHGLHMCCAFRTRHAEKLIEKLCSDCCCDRIKAAEKLGNRLHADYCCDPEVLSALIRALQNDSCWEVRRAAAWSILSQQARTEDAVLALYLASRLDRHYLVRDRAAEALDILLVCRRDCFKDLFARADVLVVELRKAGAYRPGTHDFTVALQSACGGVVMTE